MFYSLIAQATTMPSSGSWGDEILKIILGILGAIGGSAGIIAIIMAWFNRGKSSAAQATAGAALQNTQNLATQNAQQAKQISDINRDMPVKDSSVYTDRAGTKP